jgi:RND superfamily putative drug exporter
MASVGGEFVDSFNIPGAESQKAIDLLEEKFPTQAGDSATIAFKADAGINDPAVKQQIDDLLKNVAAIPEVVGVVSPYDDASHISADGLYARADVQFDKASNEIDDANVEHLTDLVDAAAGNGLQVEAGGSVIGATETEPGGLSELIGIFAAMIILLVVFGSIVAMGLPIISALIGLMIAVFVTYLAANLMDFSTFTTAFLSMIGLGVGIDYALFIVTRYRELIHRGEDVNTAVVKAITTSGRAVIFAGMVVAIALLGLLAMGIPFVAALGIASAIVVVCSVIVATMVLPAILAAIGPRIDKWRIPGLGKEQHGTNGFWFRWARGIQARPWPFAIASVAIMIVLTIPVTDLRLGSSDDGNGPDSVHTRRAYDLLAEGFGPGFNGPLLITIENPNGFDQASLDQFTTALQGTENVAAVSPANINPAGDTAIVTVIPKTSPQDEATSDLVDELRDTVIPSALAGSGTNAYVGGGTATFIDLGDKISERLPIFIIVVIGLSILLLTAVFRSIVVPIKAAIMNLLSLGAAFGVIIAVFQWGWAKSLLGVSKDGPIESFLPMLLFGVLFGLSMDYEVFLMSRVHEEYVHLKDGKKAIFNGVGHTARVVAAAAIIMGSVFLSFILNDARVIKEFGLGLGIAILVDAFLVRLVMLPAVMTLLGDAAWYLPKWLDRALPRLSIEGPAEAPAPSLTSAGHD